MCMKWYIIRPCSHAIVLDIEYCTQALRPTPCSNIFCVPVRRTDCCQVVGCSYLGDREGLEDRVSAIKSMEAQRAVERASERASEEAAEEAKERASGQGLSSPRHVTTAVAEEQQVEVNLEDEKVGHGWETRRLRCDADGMKQKSESKPRQDSVTASPLTEPTAKAKRRRSGKRWEVLEGWH